MSATTTPAEDWSAVARAWGDSSDYVERHSTESTEALVAAAGIQPGDRVLELAAGPGSLAGRWAELAGPTGRVLVSDVAPGMVEVARARTRDLANVDVAVLDATAIDRPDASFDVVVCRMGLMFAPEPAVAIREVRRVLTPAGRFAALTWGAMEHNPWMTCVGMAAMVNGVVAGGPPVGPGGIFSLGDPAHVASLVAGAGFTEVTVEEVGGMFRSPSIADHVERVSSLAGPLAAAFAAATPEQLAAVHETAAQLAAPHVTEEGVALPSRAILVAGRA